MKTLLIAAILGGSGIALAQSPDADFFEKKIRPVLTNQCALCHNEKQKMAGLDFSSVAGIDGRLPVLALIQCLFTSTGAQTAMSSSCFSA